MSFKQFIFSRLAMIFIFIIGLLAFGFWARMCFELLKLGYNAGGVFWNFN